VSRRIGLLLALADFELGSKAGLTIEEANVNAVGREWQIGDDESHHTFFSRAQSWEFDCLHLDPVAGRTQRAVLTPLGGSCVLDKNGLEDSLI